MSVRGVVAVDAGRTNCRAAVFAVSADGSLGRVASAAGASEATLADPHGPARVAATVGRLTAELSKASDLAAPPDRLVVAAAGVVEGPALAELADRLVDGAAGEVLVACDVVAAHAGAFGGDAGVVLAVGTGAIALAVAEGGRHAVVDGGGFLIGDAGSGFAIGRAGLAAAMRHVDGRSGGSAALAVAAAARFGPIAELPHILHSAPDPARRVASFAADVAAAAGGDDGVALAILRDAAAELAGTVLAAGAALPPGDRRVALVGTLFEVEPLTARLLELTADRIVAEPMRMAPDATLAGAARLAVLPAGVYGALVATAGQGQRSRQ